MGGFHLFERSLKETCKDDRGISQEDGQPLHPPQAVDLVDCDGYESFIMPTKAEIQDRGKSDWLAKLLVLLQTLWFIMQCIARAREHLPVTHLEIVTLAYAAMNFVIYIFWWNKPLNVNRPVRVFRKSDPNTATDDDQPRRSRPIEWKLSLKVIGESLKTLCQLIVAGEGEKVDMSRKDRVPMFWADDRSGDHFAIADFTVLGIGVCFGAIHCIAWHFSFPTPTELLMWRISSVAITAVPVYIPLMMGLGFLLSNTDFDTFGDAVLYFGPSSGGILYIIARAVTLILAFTSLRDLPPGAYQTVHWTTFIPHV